MRNSTYKLLVEVDIPLHNVPVVDNCDTLLVLYLIRNLILLDLHLCSLLCLLSMHYTEASGYTVRYCTEVVLRCTVVARYCIVVAQYYTIIVQCCMELELG
jgi:hypothetical protein